MGSGHPPPIWKFRHAPISFCAFWCTFLGIISVTLKWQWKGKGGGKHVLFLASIILLFFLTVPWKKEIGLENPIPFFMMSKERVLLNARLHQCFAGKKPAWLVYEGDLGGKNGKVMRPLRPRFKRSNFTFGKG